MRSFLHNFLADDRGAFQRVLDLAQHARDTGLAITDATLHEVVAVIPQLRGLQLNGCTHITDAGLWAIARQCPQLDTIHLAQCARVTELGLRLLAHNCPLGLVELSECPQITDTVLQTLAAGCWTLHTLVLRRCARISDAGIVKIAQCCKQNLRHVDVSECEHVGEYGDKALVEIGKWCPQLTHLDLFGCRHVHDAGVRAIARGCPLVTTLKLTGCRDVSSIAIQALASQCLALHTLSLAGCIQTTNADAVALAIKCKALTWLDISGSPNIDAVGVHALAQYCKQLTYLNLSDCQRINDAALEALSTSSATAKSVFSSSLSSPLATLALANCPRITETGVARLTKACTNLTTLDLTDCAQIGRRFLQKLIHELTFVEWAATFFGFQPLPNAAELCKQRDRRILEWKSAVKIQAVMRGCLARGGLWEAKLKYVQRHVLPKIQARVRGFLMRKRIAADKQHKREHAAASRIGREYRNLRLRRKLARAKRLRRIQASENEAALVFQRLFRGYQSRTRVRNMKAAIQQELQAEARIQVMLELATIKVQRAYRGHRGRCDATMLHAAREASQRQAQRELEAVLFVQRVYRGHQGRQQRAHRLAELLHRKKQHDGAVKMQKVVRGHRGRRNALILRQEAKVLARINAAMTIQRYWRGLRQKHLSAVLLGLIKLRAREHEAASAIQRAYRVHMSRGFVRTMRLTLIAQRKRVAAAITIQRVLRGHRGRAEAEVQRELRKLEAQAKPLFAKQARLHALIEDQRERMAVATSKLRDDEQNERALTLELEKTMQIKTKYHDSSRITGTPQRFLTQYLQVQLAEQLRALRIAIALDTQSLEQMTTQLQDAEKQHRLVLRQLEPLTHGVIANTKANRTARLQQRVRRERHAATQIQRVLRGFRVRCAVREGGNCWIELWTSGDGTNGSGGSGAQPAKLQATYYFHSGTKEYQWEHPPEDDTLANAFQNQSTRRRRQEWIDEYWDNLEELLAMTIVRPSAAIGPWQVRVDPISEHFVYFHPEMQQVKASLSPRSVHMSISNIRSSRTSRRSPESIRTGEHGSNDSGRNASSARSVQWQYRYGYEYDVASGHLVASSRPRPVWSEHLDPASGLTYYFNALTNEYRWERPQDVDATFDEYLKHPNASRAWFEATQQQQQGDANNNREPTSRWQSSQRTTRALGKKWVELMNPETQHTYYYNEITGETRWSLSPRSARSEADDEQHMSLALHAQVKRLREAPVAYESRDKHMEWLESAITEKNWKQTDAFVQQILIREQSRSVSARKANGERTNEALLVDAFGSASTSLEEGGRIAEADVVMKTPLASDWVSYADGNGAAYFYNQRTGETSWTAPVDAPAASVGEEASSSSEWQRAFDADGNAYYYNAVTEETSWTDPTTLFNVY
uniref:WW domain-containing protein n=1 Tax=Globisporangium ultimum (strain ATCC 200006 / CBS 805.95 / DAOM BR144) TaxID=431595 RepID=K3X4C0_GLOUD